MQPPVQIRFFFASSGQAPTYRFLKLAGNRNNYTADPDVFNEAKIILTVLPLYIKVSGRTIDYHWKGLLVSLQFSLYEISALC